MLLLRFVFVVNLCWGCLLVEEDRIFVVGCSLFFFFGGFFGIVALVVWSVCVCVCVCVFGAVQGSGILVLGVFFLF